MSKLVKALLSAGWPLFESGECIVYFTNGNPACPGAGAAQNPAGGGIVSGSGSMPGWK